MKAKFRWLWVFILVVFACGKIAILSSNVNAEADIKAEKSRIVGRWARRDRGYVLDIRDIRDDGKLEAFYFNPRSINVSRAYVTNEDSKIKVFVELQDKMYPGSYYTLVYDSPADRLVGVYHHLGIGQNFNVSFIRQE
jgi:hypothetical protein